MKTDALFYRIARQVPESIFELIGRPPAHALGYRFDAVEIKDTAVRIDGLYVPLQRDNAEPVYFVEFQNHTSERTYSNLLLKLGLYLEKVNPRQNWHMLVIYPNRAIEQEALLPYRCLLQSDQMTRTYLDELPELPPGKFGLEILKLLAAKPAAALTRAQTLIPQLRVAELPGDTGKKLVELIETVVLYQFPDKSRKELEKMLQVNDVRETRVFQEALEEGLEKGLEQGLEKGKQLGVLETKEAVARRLLAKNFPLQEVASISGLTAAQIKKLKKKKQE